MKIDNNKTETQLDASLDGMPDVTTNRESMGNRNIKIMGIAMLVLLIVLIGSGLTFNRYNAKKEQQKQLEAQQALLDQQAVNTPSSPVDLEADLRDLAIENMYTLSEPNKQNAVITPIPVPLVIPPTPPSSPPVANNNRFKPIPKPETIPPNTGATLKEQDYSALTKSLENINHLNDPNLKSDNDKPVQAPLSPLQQKLRRLAKSNVMAYETKNTTTQATDAEESASFADRFNASTMVNGIARQRGDTSLLLSKGTSIPCVLKTKIVSDYQGFTTCQVSQDVYSANGQVLLIDRGSSVIGEQSTAMENGKASIFILWTTLETPNGVSVDLSSPATGPLGEMGIPAGIKTHFWKRFGGALMLSFIEDALTAAAEEIGENADGSNNTIVNTTEESTESIAEKALESTIDMPPTAIVNQGSLLNILVVRDIDFGGVYDYK